MITRLLSQFTLAQAYKKGIRGGSRIWKYGYLLGVTIKTIKYFTSKAEPKTFEQYDLEPGEYRVIVKEEK